MSVSEVPAPESAAEPPTNIIQHIRNIIEGSCDTEDWSNDAENSALPHRYKHFKIYSILIKKIYYFTIRLFFFFTVFIIK